MDRQEVRIPWFPDRGQSLLWLQRLLHPGGLRCPRCEASVGQARIFRRTKRSQLLVYRCKRCGRTYNLYTGTPFEQHHLSPPQVLYFLQGISLGRSTRCITEALGVSYVTVWKLRREIEAHPTLISRLRSLGIPSWIPVRLQKERTMAFSGAEMSAHLQVLKDERRNGSLNEREFYVGLIGLLRDLAASLAEETQILTSEVRKQIPLLLVFLEDQLLQLEGREG